MNRDSLKEIIHREDGIPNNISSYEWRHFHLKHRDVINTKVVSLNGALNDNETESDGVMIDMTVPYLNYLNDGETKGVDIAYQV